jgi:hypothetical protein
MATPEERIAALERQVKQLTQQFQPISTFFYQKGPIPGALNAGRIGQGPTAKSAMWLNLDGNVPGSAPIQTETDAAGIQRVQVGNLAAYTDPKGVFSPSGPGERVLDASGVILQDSIGISQAASQPFATIVLPTFGYVGATNANVTMATMSFTLTRQTKILFLCGLQASMAANGTAASVTFNYDDSTQSAFYCLFNTNAVAAFPLIDVKTFPAGAHSETLNANFSIGGTLDLIEAVIIGLQLGG